MKAPLYSEPLKQALGYPRFKGAPRVLVFDADYLTVRDIIDGAAELGWTVATLKTKTKGTPDDSFLARLLEALVLNRPDFILTVNHLGFDEAGVLSKLLNCYEIPTASWFVDHPLPIIGGAVENATSNTQVFCFERSALDWIRSQGYQDPVYLPTGSNRRWFHPDRINRSFDAQMAMPLSFVGNSWWSKARVEPSKPIRKAAKKLKAQIEINRRTVANGFARQLDRATLKTRDPRGRFAAASVALAEASMATRQRFAKALQPVGLTVFGDPYWEQLVPGITLKPGVDYKKDLPALFHGSDVNANVTAEQMPTAVNQRVWDVPSVKGFLLTDAQEDALEFFVEDEEIVVYRSLEEAKDKARFYIDHPELRAPIAQKAFDKVDQAHRISHRLEQMAKTMRARFK